MRNNIGMVYDKLINDVYALNGTGRFNRNNINAVDL